MSIRNLITAGRAARLLTGMALCLAFLGCAAKAGPVASNGTIEQRPLREVILLSGEVRTGAATELLAPMLGLWPVPIETIVEEGTMVEAGQPIAEFDDSNLASDLTQRRQAAEDARSGVLTTRSRLAAEEADARFEVESKRLDLQKADLAAAVPEDLLSELEYRERQLTLRRAQLELATAETKLETQLRKAEAEIGIAEVELQRALTEVDRIEQALEVAVLEAPRAGVVEVAFNQDEGRPYRSGDNAQPGQPVARFPDYSTLQIEAQLFDVDQGTVEVGARARVELDAYPERSFQGRVADIQEIAQQTDFRSARRMFRLIVELEDPDPEIMRVGMSAKVAIDSERATWNGRPARIAPRAALRFDRDPGSALEGGRLEARLRGADGWRAVEVGRCSFTECIVTEIDPEQSAQAEAGRPTA